VFISSPTVLHVLSISSTFLWLPDKYVTRTKNHAFFSSLLLHPPLYANAFLSTLFSNILGLCYSVNARHTVLHPTKRKVKLQLRTFQSLGFQLNITIYT
jgi:hypothetical protein